MNRIPFLFLVVLFTSGCASVPHKVWTAPVTYNFHLQEQSAFVQYPTIAGDVIGFPASIIALPLMPFLEPEDGEGAGWGLFLLGPSLVGDITGTPFLILRRTLWDFPKWCIKPRSEKDPANQASEATSEPAPGADSSAPQG
jgi:hypothetical protein